ncbi:MAG: Rid family detoxifying hydrolase [Geminicoccaceae bacterium]|nr:Rid family detoxifying hydrolase [Geminicoccaceae bacterium]MCB2009477.1 Rid family detoxifying hydrolase [Geminicoccaceae bacterium]
MPRQAAIDAPAGMPYSRAIRAGDYVYVSGQVPFDPDGNLVTGSIEVETRQVMENIKRALEEMGCSMDDVVKCTCWLDDARNFVRFNKVYVSYFNEPLPARSCVESRLMITAKVEVEAIAYKPEGA